MKHVLPVAIVAVLIAVATTLSLSAGGGGKSEESAATLFPEVWEALQSTPSVQVYVALRRPDVPPEEITYDERLQHASATQESVLSALGPEDFELTHAFEYSGLSGRVTESGLLILAEHPDVRGVEIPERATYANGPPAAFAALTGTAYRLVDRTFVDGVVVHQTEVPVTDGRIVIPELGINLALSVDGSFSFTDLPVSADPPTEVTVIFTAPGLGSFTFLNLGLYPGNGGPILTPQLTDSPRVDDLSRR